MRRREFIAGIGAAWLIELHAARAQQRAVPTIGVLDLRPPSAPQTNFVDPFRRGLAEAGFVEGRNVAIEIHSAEGRGDRLPALAANLALRRVALIFTPTGSAPMPAKEATRTIPVVFAMGGDPVETRLVASLNHQAVTSPAAPFLAPPRHPNMTLPYSITTQTRHPNRCFCIVTSGVD
jgi:putative tryptophan/tyrosine transport system substrate-binding protein